MDTNIDINKGLFAAYTGLIASGYDMSDKNDGDIQRLIRMIRANEWCEDIVRYFSRARTDRFEVNPYWPRGSCISAACAFITTDESVRYESFEDFKEFLISLKNIDEGDLADDVLQWLEMLPDFIGAVVGHSMFEELWSEYRRIIMQRYESYMEVINKAWEELKTFLGAEDAALGNIIFMPSLFQATADFALKRGKTYVIKAHPDDVTIVHEYLHQVVKPYRRLFSEYASAENMDRIADIGKMKTFGYAWNDERESVLNVMEECIVRALSFRISSVSANPLQLEEYVRFNTSCGFLLVAPVAEYAGICKPLLQNLGNFLVKALDFSVGVC